MFKRVSIIGAGFMGASLAIVLKERYPKTKISVFARNDISFKRLKKLKIADRVTKRLEDIVVDADLVVLSLPVTLIVEYFTKISALLKKDTIVMDLGSTKHAIIVAAQKQLKYPQNFVGCHPLCGSEKHGAQAARADLYKGALCIITSPESYQATKKVKKLWKALGVKVKFLNPITHDKMLSAVSHLPHILSFTLAQLVPSSYHEVAGPSFWEMTRIAASSPQLWCDIFSVNRNNLIQDISQYIRFLEEYKGYLEKNQMNKIYFLLQRANKKINPLRGR